MRWITVGPADQPSTSIVLSPPAVDPGLTDDERRTIVELAGRSLEAEYDVHAGPEEDGLAQDERRAVRLVPEPLVLDAPAACAPISLRASWTPSPSCSATR